MSIRNVVICPGISLILQTMLDAAVPFLYSKTEGNLTIYQLIINSTIFLCHSAMGFFTLFYLVGKKRKFHESLDERNKKQNKNIEEIYNKLVLNKQGIFRVYVLFFVILIYNVMTFVGWATDNIFSFLNWFDDSGERIFFFFAQCISNFFYLLPWMVFANSSKNSILFIR